MPKTTIPEAKRKSQESRKTVDTRTRVSLILARSETGVGTQHDSKPVRFVSVDDGDHDTPESTRRAD